MESKPIKSESDYQNGLKRLEVIFDASIDTKEGDEAEILSLLMENYENGHYPIGSPNPYRSDKNTHGGAKYASKGLGRNNWWKKPRIGNFK